jgi:hypothetical protein
MGLPRPVVSESRTTNSPPDNRERAHLMASSLLFIRVGEASVRVLLALPILRASSPDAGALTTTGPLHLCLFPTVFVNLIVRKKHECM